MSDEPDEPGTLVPLPPEWSQLPVRYHPAWLDYINHYLRENNRLKGKLAEWKAAFGKASAENKELRELLRETWTRGPSAESNRRIKEILGK